MPRKNIYLDDETAARLVALTAPAIGRPLYASDSEAIRVAVERLHRYHFNPASGASDEVLERLRAQLAAAQGMITNELARRAEEEPAVEPMTAVEIAELNAAYEAARVANPDESTHILTYEVAMRWGLEVVRRDDQSGILYRNSSGEHVYGWESGGFDDQIDGE